MIILNYLQYVCTHKKISQYAILFSFRIIIHENG